MATRVSADTHVIGSPSLIESLHERKREGERVRNIDEIETSISCLLHTPFWGCARNQGGGEQLHQVKYRGPPTDAPAVDTAEQVYISSLALLKMLKHGRAGVPMEVMGLMLGEFVDDYTVRVIDVFAMPQSGTGVSVEAVDPVFQAKMLDMLKQTGRPEMVVGWYHSHPGFGCWLSGVDINTQQSFEALSERAVAVVVDPIQSVKGKVVIDAFRLINANMMVLGHEPRQTTSNLGHLNKPSIQALIHGLNRHYYSITINYRKNELEQKLCSLLQLLASFYAVLICKLSAIFVGVICILVLIGELGACPLMHQAFQKPPAQRRLLKGLVPVRWCLSGQAPSSPAFDGPRRDVSSLPQRPLLCRSTAMAQTLSSCRCWQRELSVPAGPISHPGHPESPPSSPPRARVRLLANRGHSKVTPRSLLFSHVVVSLTPLPALLPHAACCSVITMLLNLHKKSWMEGLTLQDYSEHCKHNESVVKEMLELAKNYNKAVEEEDKMTPEQLAIKNVGKQDPKRHLEEHVDVLMTSNIVQCLAAMLDTVVFK
ncbi:hypothetical protein QTO34_002972 [Cnephaeus nilssonii]|nr:hypothetical protein QTO34_002972 [Eptesicus nilssonii]